MWVWCPIREGSFIFMYCLICEPLIELEKTTTDYDEVTQTFIQEYRCPSCNTLHECTSQSGDMVQEYLNIKELENKPENTLPFSTAIVPDCATHWNENCKENCVCFDWCKVVSK
jgi:hypothetical protein